MLQMRAYLLVIAARVVKAKMRREANGHHPEKIARRDQRVPRMLIAAISVCLQKHSPQFRLEIPIEVFSEFAGVSQEPGLHTNMPYQHLHKLHPYNLIKHVFGIGDFFSL
jgi:hypothetical protein